MDKNKITIKLDEHTDILNSHTEKLDEHGRKLDEHGKILNEHTHKLDEHGRKLDEHGKVLDEHTDILNSHTEQLDTIANTVLANTEKLEKLDVIEEKINKLPTSDSINEVLTKIDKLLKTATDSDQEGKMRSFAIKRVEEKSDKNAEDIQTIKPLVGLAT